ncbi:MAG: PAS domain S-box protein [Oscillatoriales cyanobacterium]|nr:MAG: PAS domain S-box protein [Oscillatoriales cyanobacterium]
MRFCNKQTAYEIQILAYLAQGQPQDAVYTAIDAIGLFGIRLPKNPTQPQVLLGLAKTKLILGNKKPEQLVNLPTMTDANKLAAMRILYSAASAAYLCAPKLMPLLVFERVNLSVRHGNTALSAFGYAWYGLILCGILVDIEAGYQFGQLALQLLERFNATDLRAKVLFMTYTFISHWRDRIADTMPALLTAYQSGLETGDVEYAAALVYSYNRYWTGENLRSAEAGMRSLIAAIAPFNQKNGSLYIQIYHQATLNLLGDTSDPSCLSGESYRVAEDIPAQVVANDRTGLFFSYVCQQHLHYLFGQYDAAIEKSKAAKPYFSLPTVLHFFYDSLAQLAIYATATSKEQKQILKSIEANQKQLKKWGHYAPMNYQHKFLLVEAERYRVLGQKLKAIDYYDRAILLAKENQFLNEEALANELAAKFYLDWDKQKVAQSYMQGAYYCYAKWGAKAKIDDLETRYPQLLSAILQTQQNHFSISDTRLETLDRSSILDRTIHTTRSSSSSISESLDFATILKASQALSSEIQLEKLVSNLMQVVMENAGAKKAGLLLLQDGILMLEALADADQNISILSVPVSSVQKIPVTLINYVKRSLKTVVIDDATAQNNFSADPYLMQEKPHSVLCTSILNQGKLIGLLYLENGLTIGAFTRDRTELIQLLCTQAAISIENARLYGREQDKSQDLQVSLDQLEQSELRFRNLFENSPDAIFLGNKAGFIDCNQATVALFGYTHKDQLLKLHPSNVSPEFQPDGEYSLDKANRMIANGLETGSYQFEWMHQRANGEEFWTEVLLTMILYDGAEALYGVVRDISDRKQAEVTLHQKSQELEQTLQDLKQAQLQMVQNEKMATLGNLVAGVAHEINNPIGFIAGSVNNIEEYIQDLLAHLECYQKCYPEPVAEVSDNAEDIDLEFLIEDLPKLIPAMKIASQRIREISNSLRTFSRADTAEKVACDIHQGINSTLLILKYRLKASEKRPAVEVISEYGKLPLVKCFLGQLNQVFMNIIANAIDAFDAASAGQTFAEIQAHPQLITICTEVSGDRQMAVIRIRDNGPGMSEEVRSHIFDHLFTTKEVGKGTGLGLAIARQIVEEKHGGKLTCISAPSKGTEFVIEILID